MTFNGTAASLTRHGYARPVDVAEGLDLLQQAYETQPGAVRRERARGRQLHLQLLRLLLRGDDRGAQASACCNPVHTTNFLPADRRGGLQRLRQVRQRLPGGGDDAGLGQRSAPAEARRRPSWTRSSAWAAASACGPARTHGLTPALAPRARHHAAELARTASW